jgi:L-rhamnose mutarotase
MITCRKANIWYILYNMYLIYRVNIYAADNIIRIAENTSMKHQLLITTKNHYNIYQFKAVNITLITYQKNSSTNTRDMSHKQNTTKWWTTHSPIITTVTVSRGVNSEPVPSYWPKPGTGSGVPDYWNSVTGTGTGYPCYLGWNQLSGPGSEICLKIIIFGPILGIEPMFLDFI